MYPLNRLLRRMREVQRRFKETSSFAAVQLPTARGRGSELACVSGRLILTVATSRLRSLGFCCVPNVQEAFVRGRRYMASGLSSGAVQRRTHVLFGISQIGQRDLEGSTFSKLVEVAQNGANDFLVLAVSRPGNVQQRQGLELRCRSIRFHFRPRTANV